MRRPEALEVHLWCFRLSPPDRLSLQLLTEDERARAERYRFERDRDRFAAGRAMARRILGAYVDAVPSALRFSFGASGKPVLLDADGLRFNLSHTGDTAALAVADGFDVGVDVERFRPITEDLAERYFAAGERAALRALPPDERERAFFRVWTRKEAYLKAVGGGLTLALDGFDVSVGCAARLLSVAGDGAEAARWQMYAFAPAPDVVGAIAARRTGWRVVACPPPPAIAPA